MNQIKEWHYAVYLAIPIIFVFISLFFDDLSIDLSISDHLLELFAIGSCFLIHQHYRLTGFLEKFTALSYLVVIRIVVFSIIFFAGTIGIGLVKELPDSLFSDRTGDQLCIGLAIISITYLLYHYRDLALMYQKQSNQENIEQP